MHAARRQIYWGNALFTEADRRFNTYCASRLREAGYDVFLPQEADVNAPLEGAAPTAEDIFRVDTTAILNSCLFVACLDQETIDSGVACEIGIAYAFNIPIVGLYTDIRQFRRGRGQMYKNLYVIGAVKAIGEIVTSVDELLEVIPKYLSGFGQIAVDQDAGKTVAQHYESVASVYSDYVERLESWYQPPWHAGPIVAKWVHLTQARRVLEIGCGTGELGHDLCSQYPNLLYMSMTFPNK